ncbi:type II toxin-antitoxin system prevent-host-death family antitoxin [Mycoplana sp. MJR14]|uniref:type II toxin-antitoxin system Phd/YefM family antitoxin n=1 Tax=Mycoplana sp. MJR14 TaxID=3032583 RepID=UPI000DD855D7|nr:type II toxin-antitoxin system prevent-host-death family antitoxin [Mycoplana sp. MJR14]MDF1635549.1 type II toxin-antitoxin system prevent-host-death family antitoxin [Mycoplana sp. MJR14]
MKIVSLSDLRANMARHFDQIENDHDELIVTRQNREPMVVMSLADFESWKETMYLLANPANRERLARSVEELNEGKGVERTMDDLLSAARK